MTYTRPKKRAETTPSHEEAAEKKTVTVWACRVCGRAWEDSPRFDAENAARACHTGQRRCDAFLVETRPSREFSVVGPLSGACKASRPWSLMERKPDGQWAFPHPRTLPLPTFETEEEAHAALRALKEWPVVHAFHEAGGVEDETRAHCGAELAPADSCSDDVGRINCHLCAPQNRIRCDSLSVPHRTLCTKHLAESDQRQWERRPVEKWDGVAMIYSDALDEWFTTPDDAVEKAADRVLSLGERRADDGGTLPEDAEPTAAELQEELGSMRLVVGVPVHARHFELEDHVHDDLPSDEYGDGPDLSSVAPAVDALNAALEALPPLSWTTGKARLDLEGLVK